MKNSILLIATFLITTVAVAQEKEWKIALHLDPNVSWMKPDNKNIDPGSMKIKFGFGIMIDKMFTDNYAFGTGLNILNTGGTLTYFDRAVKDGNNVVREVQRTYNLKYLEIPLTLKLRTNEIGYITYWAQFGLGLGFNIKATGDNELRYVVQDVGVTDSSSWVQSDFKKESTQDDEIKDDIRLFRASLIVAAGIEYNLSGNSSILVGVSFNNAFSNVLNSKGVVKDATGNVQYDLNTAKPYRKIPTEFDLKTISNLISLNVGFLF